MADGATIWGDNVLDPVRAWVVNFFSAADTRGEQAAQQFADCFSEDAHQEGMGAPLNGREEIRKSRLGAWDSVETRKHVLHKVYSLDSTSRDILILGKLESMLKNGKSFEMEFAAQAIFEDATSSSLKCKNYKIWADKRIALEAAKQ
ncbi:uncharacterized protein A1O5_12295 [Cladophialophora psammophila CBS 110553]|uniref:SnoaL-like domain-containing protein n=1 Tax=Cladophialophora psammophila CBS 110553 TaxID=1182543 RepID=W9WLV4_9EURO|nr:uncharacterized protein A1O5_12295 [Cladophialophora psammophila CBS 110553]EXJ59414.1 hypothetical protein A1O5_12295 [Cladophialophora psammophila CBS 110553]